MSKQDVNAEALTDQQVLAVSAGEWPCPEAGDGIDGRWMNAFIATRLQDVLARRFFGTPFPKLSLEDRTSLRMRVEGFITAMTVVFGERKGREETARAMLRDMGLFENTRRG